MLAIASPEHPNGAREVPNRSRMGKLGCKGEPCRFWRESRVGHARPMQKEGVLHPTQGGARDVGHGNHGRVGPPWEAP